MNEMSLDLMNVVDKTKIDYFCHINSTHLSS